MAFSLRRLFGGGAKNAPEPQAAVQSAGGGLEINSAQQLEEALRTGAVTASGQTVTANNAMKVAAVYGCIRIRTGVVANLPIDVKRRIDERTREDASDTALWNVLKRKPNSWQTPSQFKRMMHAHLLLRGNAYAAKVVSRGQVIGLIPLHPDRTDCRQNDDQSLSYVYTRRDGRQVQYSQKEIFHLVGLSLDGVHGVSVLTYARESIGESMAMTDHGSTMFRNGARVSGVLRHPKKLDNVGRDNIRASLDEFRSGGDRDGKVMILEEDMSFERIAMTSTDAQWIESRNFTRTDIAMFFGVPPHMLGVTEKSTSWGTGLEQQTQGFVTFSAEDDLTTWEETIDRDLITDNALYARFNRNALVKGDLKARWDAYVKALQWGVFSPNKVLELEDENPREGGDIFYPPPNTAGGQTSDDPGDGNDPSQSA